MSTRIEVTAEDIANGVRNDAERCAVARACERAGFRGVEVDLGKLSFYDDGDEDLVASATLPDDVWARIEAFDKGEPVEPFAFDLDVTP
jgi:hypothetical protein